MCRALRDMGTEVSLSSRRRGRRDSIWLLLPESRTVPQDWPPRVSSCHGLGFKMKPAESDGIGRVGFPGARGKPHQTREAERDVKA